MGWAKSYFSPDWLPNSFIYEHWVSHRFVFETFFGFLISALGLETSTVMGRLLAAGALSWSLARYFQQIKLSNLESLLVVVVFITLKQRLLPGEWIFMTVQPKVFAYPLIFLSVTELIKGNQKLATLYIVASTYLHVLVAGWFFVYFIIYLIWNKIQLRELAQISGLYLLGVLPLLLFLVPEILSGPSDINGVHLNWIYVFYRVPSLAPFVNGELNISHGWKSYKIITVAGLLGLALAVNHKKLWPQEIRLFNKFNIIIPVLLLVFFVLAYFDRTGDMLKFYPFRGVSLYLFFILTEIALLSKLHPNREKVASSASIISVAVLVLLIAYGTGRNLANNYIDHFLLRDQKDKDWTEVISFAKNKTEKGSIFHVKGIRGNIYRSFSRHTDRDLFVLFKFVPVDKSKWYEWYQRLNINIDDQNSREILLKKYKLDYYITIPSRPRIGEVVFENSHFVVSRLND